MKIVIALSLALLVGASSAANPLAKPLARWPGALAAFPRVKEGECPGSYRLWSYRQGRAPICVQDA